jgi:hypothetical protein
VPNQSRERVVLLLTRDLFFRAKLEGLVRAAGGTTVREGAADAAVLELAGDASIAQITALVAQGIPVIAFASHVQADLLRAAREAGARAVPNSRVEETLRAWLTQPG